MFSQFDIPNRRSAISVPYICEENDINVTFMQMDSVGSQIVFQMYGELLQHVLILRIPLPSNNMCAHN